MRVLVNGVWRNAREIAEAKSHREAYPEQYSHLLVGRTVDWSGGKRGTVKRVILSTPHGDLAELVEHPGTFYCVCDLTEVTP